MRVAIQGEYGSFSHEDALKLNAGASIAAYTLSADVFAALDAGKAEAAVIPIENSLAGSVLEHFDLLLKHDVRVERETLLRIRHNLITVPGASIDQIDRVFSHPVALAQCRRFLAAHPQMESLAFYDTAGSVKQLMELHDTHAGAIASRGAAAFYGAQILCASIEDNPENSTRFFLVRRAAEATQDPEANKISIAFSVENRPGTLVAALNALNALGTNLTKIESRPLHGKPWEYLFYLDYMGQVDEERSRNALRHLRELADLLRVLGCYPAA
jgi:prephenate dehydratase